MGEDPELLAEVANLVEEPHVVLGRFDPAYLDQVRVSPYYADYVPADVIAMKASSDDLVVIFGIEGELITSVLVGFEDILLFS